VIAFSGPVAFIWLGIHFPTDGLSGEKSYLLVRTSELDGAQGDYTHMRQRAVHLLPEPL
jgi:hypothetical protein